MPSLKDPAALFCLQAEVLIWNPFKLLIILSGFSISTSNYDLENSGHVLSAGCSSDNAFFVSSEVLKARL